MSRKVQNSGELLFGRVVFEFTSGQISVVVGIHLGELSGERRVLQFGSGDSAVRIGVERVKVPGGSATSKPWASFLSRLALGERLHECTDFLLVEGGIAVFVEPSKSWSQFGRGFFACNLTVPVFVHCHDALEDELGTLVLFGGRLRLSLFGSGFRCFSLELGHESTYESQILSDFSLIKFIVGVFVESGEAALQEFWGFDLVDVFVLVFVVELDELSRFELSELSEPGENLLLLGFGELFLLGSLCRSKRHRQKGQDHESEAHTNHLANSREHRRALFPHQDGFGRDRLLVLVAVFLNNPGFRLKFRFPEEAAGTRPRVCFDQRSGTPTRRHRFVVSGTR